MSIPRVDKIGSCLWLCTLVEHGGISYGPTSDVSEASNWKEATRPLWPFSYVKKYNCLDPVQITANDMLFSVFCFFPYAALNEASVIVREHTILTNMLMCLWFNEVVRFTSRDQLSFPYVLWRLKVVKNINTFPVCTRKDLVNSMGHIRKAKPLTNWC